MSITDFNTVRPVRHKDYRTGYIQIPAFSYSYVADANVSEQAYQINYTTDRKFVIPNLPQAPSGVNYVPVIRYRRAGVTYRYKLWSTGTEVIADTVRLYNGEVIYPHFSIEIWTLPGGTAVSQASAITINVSHRTKVTDDTVDDYEVTTVKNEHDRSELIIPKTNTFPDLINYSRVQLLPGDDVSLLGSNWADSSGNDNNLADYSGLGGAVVTDSQITDNHLAFVGDFRAAFGDTVISGAEDLGALVLFIKPTSYPGTSPNIFSINYGAGHSVACALKQKNEADTPEEPKYKLEIGSTSAEISLVTGDWTMLVLTYNAGLDTGTIKAYDPETQDLLDSDTFATTGLTPTQTEVGSFTIYGSPIRIGYALLLTGVTDIDSDFLGELMRYFSIEYFGAILPISFTPTDEYNWNENT